MLLVARIFNIISDGGFVSFGPDLLLHYFMLYIKKKISFIVIFRNVLLLLYLLYNHIKLCSRDQIKIIPEALFDTLGTNTMLFTEINYSTWITT